MALVLDSGVIFGALATSDPDYARCSKLLLETTEPLVVPPLVLVEVEYFVRKFGTIPAWTTFIEDLEAGVYALHEFDSGVLRSSTDLQARYSDQPIGLVDASVFVTCEQLDEDKVATLDYRHFGVLRTEEGRALRLLPDLSE